MTQQQILELVKQGNVNAIEALINQLLKPQGIKAKVRLKDSCLYVALVSTQVPERQAIVKFIRRQMLRWGVESLRSAKIYAAQWGQIPAWQQEIPLNSVKLAVLENRVLPNVPVQTNQYDSGQNSSFPLEAAETGSQLRIGKLLMRMDTACGIAISLVGEEPHQLKPRLQPVLILPRPFPNLIGRLTEIKSAIASLESKRSIEFYGSPGLGKSVLLRHLTYFIQASNAFPDGAVYFSSLHQPVSDLLQSLFDIFYETDITYKPTHTEICQALESKQVLIFLDNQNLTPNDIKQLQSVVYKSVLALTSPQPRLETGGYTAQLSRFGLRDTLILMAQLHLSVTPEEYQTVEVLINRLDGHPWLLQLAVISIKKEVHTLAELVLKLQPPATSQMLIQQVLATFPQSQQTILAVLAAVGGAALVIEEIKSISEITDTTILKNLVEWNLVEVEGDRYRINATLTAILQQEWDLTVFINSAFEYFVTWAEQHRSLPSLLCSHDAIIEILLTCVTAERWQNVLRLVKAVESSLFLGKQWGLWEQVLQAGLQAALSLDDKSASSWMLHQLGSRALCLEQIGKARSYLGRALQIRESLEDDNATKITRQNFNLLTAVPLKPETDLPQVALQYKSANPRLQLFAVALIPLLFMGLAGCLAWYVWVQLKTPPKSNPASIPKQITKLNKIAPVTGSHQNLNFGKQSVNTKSRKQTITITNNSLTSLQVGDIKREAQGDFEISSNNCDTTPPLQSCNISIIFAPVDSGEHGASLTVTDSDGKTIKQLLMKGVAITQQPFDEILPAPQHKKEKPLELPKPKLFPPQIPEPLSIPAPIQEPIPTIESTESTKSTESTEFLTPTPTPQATELPEVENSEQPTPPVVETPLTIPDN